MPQLNTKLSEQTSSPRVSKPKNLRDVPMSLLAMFSRWRDDPSCPKEARAIFNKLADTVASVPRERRQLYLEMARLYCDGPKEYDLLSTATNETVVRIRNGEFKPKCAEVFLSAVLVLLIEKNSVASMSRIKRGDQEELRDFNNHIVRDRTYAFDTLVEAGLVICHTQPDGTVGLEWPEPHHPAVAAYLAELDDMQAGVRLAHPKTDPKGSRLKDIEDVRASVNDTLKSCQSDPPDTTVRKPATSKAQFQTIEAVRACTADVLSGFDIPLTRYELGFQMGFEELGRMLHPAGYHRGRSRSELIAGLQEPPTKTSTAKLPTIEAVREHLDYVMACNKEQPSDNRYLYGYEDANLFLWSYVDPMGFKAARGRLPR